MHDIGDGLYQATPPVQRLPAIQLDTSLFAVSCVMTRISCLRCYLYQSVRCMQAYRLRRAGLQPTMGYRSTLRSRSFLIPISHTKHMQCISHYALGVWPRYIFRKRCSVACAPASRAIYPAAVRRATHPPPASYTNAVPLYLFKRRAAAIKRCSLRLIEIIGCRSGT